MHTTRYILAILALASPALAQLHGEDVIIKLDNTNTIITGAAPDGVNVDYGVRAFRGVFGDGGVPNFTDDPGYDSEEGAFPPNTLIGFTIVKAVREWDPVGENFDSIPDETITISHSGQSTTSPPTDTPVTGFVFGGANGSGVFHQHLGYTLDSPADTGVYLFELQLWSETSSINPSESFWLVFNQNDTDDHFNTAFQWVEDNLAGGCPPDWNGDTTLNSQDFVAFLNDFTAGNADYNGDTTTNSQDFVSFLNDFVAGC